MADTITKFFKPAGVALIGASSNPGKLSYGILTNMLQYGYRGNIYPVNPARTEILGHKCYRDVRSVPEPVELAVIILPAPVIPEIVEDCGLRGIKSVIIISGGFREVSKAGAKLESKMVNIARRFGMRLIGPNCVGTVDLYSGLNTTFIKGLPESGPIGFVSQSGAVCGGVVDYFQEKGFGFSHLISLGNEADINETDMIEYLGNDSNTKVIAIYTESIRDGERFLRVADKVGRLKPIVILKAGRSEAGTRAVSSHTGSLAGSYAAYKAAFDQAGVLEAESVVELINCAQSLAYQPLPENNRVAIITNSGGPAALGSDSLASNGMRMAELSDETRAKLRDYLLPAAQVGNPVDMLGGANYKEYMMALSTVLEDEDVDAVISILVPQAIINPEEVAQSIVDVSKSSNKPVLAVMMGEKSISDARKILTRNKVPMFDMPESTGKAMGMMWQYKKHLDAPENIFKPAENNGKRIVESFFYQNATYPNCLRENESRPIIEAYGIPVIGGSFAKTRKEAGDYADLIGYPVVLKVVSPDILHKSDLGGVRLGLTNKEQVEDAYDDLIRNIRDKKPDVEIRGVLVEETAPDGVEVIVGMKRDQNFGPIVMFGMGGIFVELITDVAFRIAPVNIQQARSMVSQTKAGKLLSGLRGQNPYDIEAVSQIIERIGQISIDFPHINEIEINPLLVLHRGKGALALDARIIME